MATLEHTADTHRGGSGEAGQTLQQPTPTGLQMTLDSVTCMHTDPQGEALAGMAAAIEHADRSDPGWSSRAYSLLCRYAETHEFFISEDVSDHSKSIGMSQPPTDRAWGPLYRRAQRDGVIVQDGSGRSRRRHASICPRWRSLVFGGQPGATDKTSDLMGGVR
jgi:hypothetical protein